jgi:hypothetical protein
MTSKYPLVKPLASRFRDMRANAAGKASGRANTSVNKKISRETRVPWNMAASIFVM